MTITTPQGFRAAGVACGLKSSGKPDVALIINDGPLKVGAAVFTNNRIVAAPVTWSRQVIVDGVVHACVINSGGANALTGGHGFADTHATAEHVAEALAASDVSAGDVVVMSTGLIGVPQRMEKLTVGIDDAAAALSADGGLDAAHAIMTTDTVPKLATAQGDGWSIGGMAKGAGMLAPGLATMLSVITTDAVLTPAQADAMLKEAVRTTFNRADSDGCMSTNDTVLLMASGASGVTPTMADFQQALTTLSGELARALIADAEGASHDISVTVTNAVTEEAAEEVARAIARSNLFKAAIFGNDPNWGRILSAAGTVPENVAPYNPANLDVTINGVMVCKASGLGEPRELVDLTAREVFVTLDLHAGSSEATIWTNDLTHDYVHENSAYSS